MFLGFCRGLGVSETGLAKNGVRNKKFPYRRCGVDTEFPYWLCSLSMTVNTGSLVEAEFPIGFGGV